MPEIVLATLNARYLHCAFGLRYLLANLGDLQSRTELLEFTIQQPILEIVHTILARKPKIVGLGVYIWNIEETTRLVRDLKRICPDVVIVLGGPEVSYESEEQPIVRMADYLIPGEADLEFARYCRQQLSLLEGGKSTASGPREFSTLQTKQANTELPTLDAVRLPYHLYSDDDIAHRVIYVEASRGCPFTCEFCLSALEIPVRQFPLEPFLEAMQTLLERGARQFKFVDRTFNLNLRTSKRILEFFLERYRPGLFLHFEMIPDRLPDPLKELIVRFPDGALQFEIGIQTFNHDVCELISRRQDEHLVEQNLTWLKQQTGVHIHADLIVGLPGESLDSFAAGFDRLVHLGPHEIQVGILKRLRGTPIVRHNQLWRMIYSENAPYEILSTSLLDFEMVQELRRFAKYWDVIANSGNFLETLPRLWNNAGTARDGQNSPFHQFRNLAAWLFQQEQKTHGTSLSRLVELMFEYFTQIRQQPAADVAATLWRDYQRGGRSDKPHCLRPFISAPAPERSASTMGSTGGPRRQSRHWSEKSGVVPSHE